MTGPGTRPLVLGPRGASRDAVENPHGAFAEARDQGADGVELDVHRSADGALVVHHDAAVDGFGILAEHALGEIRAAVPSIPTLDEVFDCCAGMLVNVEVKNAPPDADFDPEERCAAAVVELVAARDLYDSVLVSSFHLPSIDRVHALDPDVPTGYLVVVDPLPLPALEIAHEHGHRALHPHLAALGEAFAADAVARARELGIALNVWTVNDPAEIIRLASLGVDGIITDTPRIARQALGRE
ncbi:MAG: glycerophosphodiester phosphodiesterase [Acidimicrobiia bacterium]